MGVWHLWLQWNAYVFKFGILDTKTTEKCIQSTAKYFAVGAKAKISISRSIIPDAWRKSPEGWAKLNTDGLTLGNLGIASKGGLVRDHNGDWITGFSRTLDSSNSFIAKLWALRDERTLAKELFLNNLIVEMDALSVVQLMNNNTVIYVNGTYWKLSPTNG